MQEYNWDELFSRLTTLEQQQQSTQVRLQQLERYIKQLVQALKAKQPAPETAAEEEIDPVEPQMGSVEKSIASLSVEEFLQRLQNGGRDFSGLNLKGLDLNQWKFRSRSSV